VVNHPAKVLATARDGSAAQLQNIPGLLVPRVERCQPSAAYFAERFAASSQGIIIRPITSQTGIGMRKVETEEELASATEHFLRQPEDLFVTDYYTFESQGTYRKMRVFRIGDELYPEHCITFNAWNVHSADRHKLMRTDNSLREQERRFVENPAHVLGTDAWQILNTATARLGLEYVGIDFAQLDDGRLLLFECNPSMRVNFDHVTHFEYLQPGLESIAQAFTQMLASRLA
jgi:glutathione synthase/RimK-type ligase-like ATP-grasp enzyme